MKLWTKLSKLASKENSMPVKLTVSALLFASGLSAMIYQLTWLRSFRLIFGSTTAAAGTVLAVFMLAIGLGSFFLGPKADKVKRPLYLFAVFELAIAITAAISPLLMKLSQAVYLHTGGVMVLGTTAATVTRIILSIPVIFLPAFLMGGTLPAAIRAVAEESDLERRGIALLYGSNTIGAVAGTFLCNFVLLELLGSQSSLFVAVFLSLLISAIAFKMSKKVDYGAPCPAPEQNISSHDSLTNLYKPVLVAAFATGFVFFLMEIVWYRMLAPILGGSSYTIGLNLTIILAALGIGSLCYSLTCSKKLVCISTFSICCAAEAFFLALPLIIGDHIAAMACYLGPLAKLGLAGRVAGWTLTSFVVIGPTSFVAGFQFPLLISLIGKGAFNTGKESGHVLAANTFGATLGSLAGAFIILPWLSAPGSWRLCVGVLSFFSLSSLIVAVGQREWKRKRNLLSVLIVLPIFYLAFTCEGPTAVWRHGSIGAGRALTNSYSANGWLMYKNDHNLE